MARRVKAQEFLDQVSWIGELSEDGGGSWGQGVIMTLKDQVKEVVHLEGVLTTVKAQISDRLKLMRSMVDSAERNAQLTGFMQEQIDEAKVEVEVKLQEVDAKAKKKAQLPPSDEA